MTESNSNQILKFGEARDEALKLLEDLFDKFLENEPLSIKSPIERDQNEHFIDRFSKRKLLRIQVPDSVFPNFWDFLSQNFLLTLIFKNHELTICNSFLRMSFNSENDTR